MYFAYVSTHQSIKVRRALPDRVSRIGRAASGTARLLAGACMGRHAAHDADNVLINEICTARRQRSSAAVG